MSSYLRRPQVCDFFLGGFATYGALWLGIESFSAFFVSQKPAGWVWYTTLLALATIGGVVRAWPRRRIEFAIPASDSSFEVRFGNIFDGDALVVIPVNEYFDGEHGDHVSETSLHGQFIGRVLAGQQETFYSLTADALANVAPEEVGVDRPSGRCDRYAIGTVARIDRHDRRYLLAALSHTDLSSLKADASVQDLWVCLAGVWKGIRDHSSGKPVNIPLIGSGLSGVGLPPKHLVEILVTSFLYHTKEKKVASRVTLVLPRRLAGDIDLKETKRRWT